MPTKLHSNELVGKKPSVSDVMSMISPTETPFISSIGTEKIGNTLYQWFEDALPEAGDNAKVEGFTAVDDNIYQPEARTNGTQILAKTFHLSRTAAHTNVYGRASEEKRVEFNNAKALKIELERAAIGTGQIYVPGDNATTPKRFAGVQAQIDPANIVDAEGAALTLDMIDETQIKLYDSNAQTNILLLSMKHAYAVSKFADSFRHVNDNNKTLTGVVDIYVGTAGELKIAKARELRAGDILFYTPKNWKLMVFDDWKKEDLAKTGDSDRKMIVGEFGLKHVNYRSSGLITNVATS